MWDQATHASKNLAPIKRSHLPKQVQEDHLQSMLSGGRVMERTAMGLQMLNELHDGGEQTPSQLVGLCMHEVRTLESSAFERIQQVKDGLDSQLEEVGVQLAELAGQLARLEVREERAGRATSGLTELRRELGLSEVEPAAPGRQHTTEAVVEVLLALRASAAQAMHDQTSKTEHDLCRSIKEVTAVISASQEALQSDLQQEVLQAHSELRGELGAQLASLAARLDEGQRARDIKQDELEGKIEAQSAGTILARLERLEAICGEGPNDGKVAHSLDSWRPGRFSGRCSTTSTDDAGSTIDEGRFPEKERLPTDLQRALDHGFARRLGEMDAELRVQLSSSVRSLGAELGARLSSLEGEVRQYATLLARTLEGKLGAQGSGAASVVSIEQGIRCAFSRAKSDMDHGSPQARPPSTSSSPNRGGLPQERPTSPSRRSVGSACASTDVGSEAAGVEGPALSNGLIWSLDNLVSTVNSMHVAHKLTPRADDSHGRRTGSAAIAAALEAQGVSASREGSIISTPVDSMKGGAMTADGSSVASGGYLRSGSAENSIAAGFGTQATTRSGGLLRQSLERPVSSCPTRLTSSNSSGVPSARNSDATSPLLKNRSGTSAKTTAARACGSPATGGMLQAGVERTVGRQAGMAERTGSRQVTARERTSLASGGGVERSPMSRQAMGGSSGIGERSNSRQAPSRSGSQGTPQDRHVRALSARPGDNVNCGGAVPASNPAWPSRLGVEGAAGPRSPGDWAARLRPTPGVKQPMGARQPQSRLSASGSISG